MARDISYFPNNVSSLTIIRFVKIGLSVLHNSTSVFSCQLPLPSSCHSGLTHYSHLKPQHRRTHFSASINSHSKHQTFRLGTLKNCFTKNCKCHGSIQMKTKGNKKKMTYNVRLRPVSEKFCCCGKAISITYSAYL
jgi:hypothetical protein